MSSLQKYKNLFQMVFPRKQKDSASDIESSRMEQHGRSEPAASLSLPRIPVDAYSRPELDPSDNLNLFRHLVGITSHPSMAHSDSFFSSGGRPAPNLGIYARVVHNEQDAKVGYKYFSWLINGCLGLQIVVAATLTALGAAGGSRGAVTVFGAVNTVFAGILTFLKGSGLPNRLKYYQSEWKRVREFIEQRERDFGRPNCDLDVYGVAAVVESMYEEVKMDLEASTPDRFAGHNSSRKSGIQAEQTPAYKFPSMSLPQVGGLLEKGKEIETGIGSKVKNLASEIKYYAQEAREVAKDLQAQKDGITEGASREVKEYTDRAERREHVLGDKIKDISAEIGQRAHTAEQVVHNEEVREHRAIDRAIQEARDHLERLEAAARSKLTDPITIKASYSGSTSTEQEGKKQPEDY
jgi:hypothetical protein